MDFLTTTLHHGQLAFLRQLAQDPLVRVASAQHNECLTRLGFATLRGGALSITTMGRAKLLLEITRANWLPVQA